eukprot:CAMPEP_0114976902 /NCGR_PEP_ID=MMETSP0216-20121206/2933_1 /TAXON_ID=223996 /ORGANISM="Protocruzia adherens, Strain Boccale" /LENGTH=308 /DNA_ID=CAMNT_0002337887 /DNA_START=210 /DNA_END=1136 /DNA_ORIENTATION=+
MVEASGSIRLFDIAANLTARHFDGVYRGRRAHTNDLQVVLKRASSHNVDRMLVTAGSIRDSTKAAVMCKNNESEVGLYSTVGVHPSSTKEVEQRGTATGYFDKMRGIVRKYKDQVVAIGECGLDYDRLFASPKDVQLKHFPPHFDMAEEFKLPMYLHCRNTGQDFLNLMKTNRDRICGGVVHCFSDSMAEMLELVDMGMYIGLTGISVRTEESIEVVKKLPLENLMLETDAPYGHIRQTHPSWKYVKTMIPAKPKDKYDPNSPVKERNEPCYMQQVLEAVAGVKEMSTEELAAHAYENTMKLLNIKEA